MPQKPDRFERAATRAAYKLTWDKEHPDGGELQTAIVNELRKEHRWVERLITKEKRELTLLAFKTRQSNDPRDIAIADCLYARVHQCEEFIRWLRQRRK